MILFTIKDSINTAARSNIIPTTLIRTTTLKITDLTPIFSPVFGEKVTRSRNRFKYLMIHSIIPLDFFIKNLLQKTQ